MSAFEPACISVKWALLRCIGAPLKALQADCRHKRQSPVGREQREIVWNLLPAHPIATGIPEYFVLEEEEMYSEPFFIPPPEELGFCELV